MIAPAARNDSSSTLSSDRRAPFRLTDCDVADVAQCAQAPHGLVLAGPWRPKEMRQTHRNPRSLAAPVCADARGFGCGAGAQRETRVEIAHLSVQGYRPPRGWADPNAAKASSNFPRSTLKALMRLHSSARDLRERLAVRGLRIGWLRRCRSTLRTPRRASRRARIRSRPLLRRLQRLLAMSALCFKNSA